jgi:hypothetical protein
VKVVHISRIERSPKREGGEWQPGPGSVDPHKVLFGGAVGKHVAEGEEHPRVRGIVAPGQVVDELGRLGGDVVDDQVGGHVVRIGQSPHRRPVAEAGVDRGVVHGVEAGIGTVEGPVEGQNVDAGEDTGERSVEELTQAVEAVGAEPVDVGDEMDPIAHRASLPARTSSLKFSGARETVDGSSQELA